jgi:hypothetical protein
MRLFFILLVFCSVAQANDWTILAGGSKFTPHGDGVWYQEPFEHKFDLVSPSLGLRYDSEVWTAGYMYLGRVTSNAKAVALDGKVPGDGGYNSTTKSCNGKCWPLSTWRGRGDVQGIFLGMKKSVIPSWVVEAGVYLYHPTWETNIPDWRGCRDCEPANLTVRHHAYWQPGPYVGVRWGPHDSRLSLNLFAAQTATRGDEWCSLYTGVTYNLSVGYQW